MKFKKEFALFYGLLLGDGCLSRTGKQRMVSIVGNIHDDLPMMEKIAKYLTILRGKNTKIKENPKQGKLECGFSDKDLFKKIKESGFPIGKKGTKLKISKKFEKKLYREIVKGIFATDGCLVITNNNGTVYPRLEFASISSKLLNQIKEFLDKIDINGMVYTSKKYSNPQYNTIYRLQINGKSHLEKFKNKIGFYNPKHQNKYEKFKSAAGGI
jgi:hypothetical protein